MKAKVYQVHLDGVTTLVEAVTLAGAKRDVVEHLAKGMLSRATSDLATGEQLYHAGRKGLPVLNSGRYDNVEDPNQLPLSGTPETAGASAGNGTPINQHDQE